MHYSIDIQYVYVYVYSLGAFGIKGGGVGYGAVE